MRDEKRVREVQDLIRTIAGDMHENGKEMEQVKAMMLARAAQAPKEVPAPAPAQRAPEPEMPRPVPPPYQPPPSQSVPVPEPPRPEPPRYRPVPPPAKERPVFCIHCGSRLPLDSLGCPVCASRNTRICPNCGTRVHVSTVSCPVCRRVMPPVVPYQRH